MAPKIATKDRLTEALALTADLDEVAAMLGVDRRSVTRGMVREGLREMQEINYFTEEQRRRAQQLADTGMPIVWIAEDLKRSARTISERIHRPEGADLEWLSVWQQIKKNPELLRLHREIAPKPRRTA